MTNFSEHKKNIHPKSAFSKGKEKNAEKDDAADGNCMSTFTLLRVLPKYFNI